MTTVNFWTKAVPSSSKPTGIISIIHNSGLYSEFHGFKLSAIYQS